MALRALALSSLGALARNVLDRPIQGPSGGGGGSRTHTSNRQAAGGGVGAGGGPTAPVLAGGVA